MGPWGWAVKSVAMSLTNPTPVEDRAAAFEKPADWKIGVASQTLQKHLRKNNKLDEFYKLFWGYFGVAS